MTSFKDVPKVPLLFLISAAERAKDWRSMRTAVIGETTDIPIKIDKIATKYSPHSPYSRYSVLKNGHSLFLAYTRSLEDPDSSDVSLELKQRRVYSIHFFNAHYSEREDDEDERIRDVWKKVDGIYRMLWP